MKSSIGRRPASIITPIGLKFHCHFHINAIFINKFVASDKLKAKRVVERGKEKTSIHLGKAPSPYIDWYYLESHRYSRTHET